MSNNQYTYLHQLSATIQEFPSNILTKIPFNIKNVATSPFRLISLLGAKNSKFISIIPDGDNIKIIDIKNYDKDEPQQNHLWRFIQVDWNNTASYGAVLIQHVYTGKYLCVPENETAPKCKKYEDLKPERFVWCIQNRTLYFRGPEIKYLVYSLDSNNNFTQLPSMTMKEYLTSTPKNASISYDWVTEGNAFIRLDINNMSVSMSSILRKDYLPPVIYKAWWWGNPPLLSNPINDLENDWYPILVRSDTGMFTSPVSEPLGLGLLRDWEAGDSYGGKFGKCRVPLKERINDITTQTQPKQSQYPKVMFGFTSHGSERYHEMKGNGFNENYEWWQYIDIFMYIAYNQGWPAPELKFLNIPKGTGVSQNGSKNLFDIYEGFIPQTGSGIMSAPPRSYVETAHKNGCKFFSVLFFQQNVFGGKWQWWSDFLKDRKIFAEKIVEYAGYYGIDGFFVNFEAQQPGATQTNGQQNPKKTPGTDCSMFVDKCDYNDCTGYWCQYTQGGNNNCDSNECTLGKWDDKGNLDFDGKDINREYFIEFLKHVREYRDLKNIKCEICMYASIGYGGDSGNYTSGIDKSLVDFWLDPVTKQPIVDMMLSMPAGGTIDPQGPVNTYSHTSEAVSSCLIKENFGWPKNTGLVGNYKCLSSDLNCVNSDNLCTENTGQDCGCGDGKDCGNKNDCLSSDKCCFDDNKPKDKPWCYKKCSQDINTTTSDCFKPFNIPYGRQGHDDKVTCDNIKNSGTGDWSQSCVYDEKHDPKCYSPQNNVQYIQTGNTICSNNNDLGNNQCGPLDKTYTIVPKNRAYDFYTGTDAENGLEQFRSQKWAKNIYCGTFEGCQNNMYPTENPLASLFVWSANLELGLMGTSDPKRSYKMNSDYYRLLYIGKTGLCNKNLGIDPYTDDVDMGMAYYVPERSTITDLPFYTSFCMGNGENFYINGEPQLYLGSWIDNIQDYLPTWRWWSKQMTKNVNNEYIESKILSLDYSTSFNGGSCLKVESIEGMVDTDFYLFKTQFSTNLPLELSVTLKSEFDCSNIMIGYTLKSNGNLVDSPQIYYFDIGKITNKWTKKTFLIKEHTSDFINSICIKTKAPLFSTYKVYIGEICIDTSKYILSKPKIHKIESFTQKTSELTNFNIYFKPLEGVLYYNIYYGDYLVGRTYGCGYDLKDNSDMVFNVCNMQKSFNNFVVEAVGMNGKKRRSNMNNDLFSNTIFLLIFISLIICLIFIGKNINFYIGAAILFIFLVLYIRWYISNIKNMKITTPSVPGNTGKLSAKFYNIENWSDCKKKAFNINFDDNRPKTWTWLLESLKKQNSPIKVTFFINTLWLNRDLEKYKKWMEQYDCDYGCHGHWHFNHTQDNFIASPDGTLSHDCWGDISKNPTCCPNNPKACVTDEQLANNDADCAKLVRQYVYNDMNKELVFAYPYGAYPVDNDGNIKPLTAKALKDNFLAARGVQWGQVLEFPLKDEPTSLKGPCSDYQGQPAGCDDGGCSKTSCNMSLNGIYDDTMTKNIGPEYSWPAGIDLNLDPDCTNCTIIEQMEIRKQSLINLLKSEDPVSIMIWGHDFHPVGSDGKTYPCDASSTLGGCSDDNCKNNAKAMAQLENNPAWLSPSGAYNCPKDIAEEDQSCYINCVRGKLDSNGNCTDTNVFGINGQLAWDQPTGYYPIESVPPKINAELCSNCADNCWNPSIGSKLLEMFEIVNKQRDNIWFAHFVEIVQYLWNRQYTSIDLISEKDEEIDLELKSLNIMRNYPITISFSKQIKITKITIDNKPQNIYISSDNTKYYIKFKPTDNYTHLIKIYKN